MPQSRKRRSWKRWILLLLLLLAAWFLPAFFPGIFPAGGWKGLGPWGDQETARVSVIVLDQDARPVAGARIFLKNRELGQTNENGEFSWDGAKSERDDAWVADGTKRGRVDGEGSRVELAPPTRAGRVLAKEPKLKKGEVVLLAGRGEVLDRARTNAKGEYAIDEDARAQSISFQPDEQQPGDAPFVGQDGDLAQAQHEEIRGRLGGIGAVRFSVAGTWRAKGSDTALPFHATWQTDADGNFVGRLPQAARAWGLVEGRVFRIASGDITLPATTTASGVVTRAGKAVSGATLSWRPMVEEGIPAVMPPLKIKTGPDGTFRLKLSDLHCELRIEAPGCATRVWPDVAPKADLKFELAPGTSVSGTVVDQHGLPIAGAAVFGHGLPEADHPIVSTKTDALGRFMLDGLGGAKTRLRVHARGHTSQTMNDVSAGATIAAQLKRR